MAAFWPIGTAQIIRIVSYPIRKKSRFWLFYMWSDKEMYHALFPWETERDNRERAWSQATEYPATILPRRKDNDYPPKITEVLRRWRNCSLVPGEFSWHARQMTSLMTSHPKSPRTTGNEAGGYCWCCVVYCCMQCHSVRCIEVRSSQYKFC